MSKITWVKGNTLPLCIKLYSITVTGGSTQREDYIPPTNSVVKVKLVGTYGIKEYTPTVSNSRVYITDDGSLDVDTYGVEVTIEETSRNLRSYRYGNVEIVDENKELSVGDYIVEDSVVLDADAFIFGGEGGGIVVDAELSTTSTHPVQNNTITTALNGKLDLVTQTQFNEIFN